MPRFNLSDYPPEARYASGTDSKLRWKWKPVDQKYIDMLNATWEKVCAPKVEEAPLKKRKGKKNVD